MPPRISNPIQFFKKFWDIDKTDHYDILYMNILTAEEIYSALPAKLCGMKIIVHAHNDLSNTLQMHKLFRPILNAVAHKRLACSENAAKFMYGRKKTEIVKNAIDVKKFRFNEEKRSIYRKSLGIENSFVICHVGRISRQKNPYAVVDIFESIYKKNKDTFLVYVGDGEDKETIEKYIEKKGITQNLLMLGSRADIPELMSMADIFILPSIYEGFGYVAIEAQASALPTIISEAVPDDTMITNLCVKLPVPLADKKNYKNIIDAWAKKIEEYRNRPKERYIDEKIFNSAGLNLNQTEERYIQYDNIFLKDT